MPSRILELPLPEPSTWTFTPARTSRTWRATSTRTPSPSASPRRTVDSVTVFGLCHHGHAYFRTSHPCRHPSLPDDLDLTGAQIDALHRRGIRAPIYLSAQVNEYAADEHPGVGGRRSGGPEGEAPAGRPAAAAAGSARTPAGRSWTCPAPTRTTWPSWSRRCCAATPRWTASSWTCAGISRASRSGRWPAWRSAAWTRARPPTVTATRARWRWPT